MGHFWNSAIIIKRGSMVGSCLLSRPIKRCIHLLLNFLIFCQSLCLVQLQGAPTLRSDGWTLSEIPNLWRSLLGPLYYFHLGKFRQKASDHTNVKLKGRWLREWIWGSNVFTFSPMSGVHHLLLGILPPSLKTPSICV